jgi:FecR protein
MKTRFLIVGIVLSCSALLSAAPLSEGTFTDVIRTVEVLDQSTKNATAAQLNELVKAPNRVRTGASSRAELTAPDNTLTRIGANTVFSFAPAGREINLEQGSVLFHSPSGRGGGTIRSGGASAAVSGTTIIVATTPVTNPGDKNGFKVIVLEGSGHVTLPSGQSRTLKAGQLIYILPGRSGFGPLLTINLSKLVNGSSLVNGFSHPLPSLSLIDAAIEAQIAQLKKGRLTDTGRPADYYASNPPGIGNGPQAPPGGDPNIYQIGVAYPPIQHYNDGVNRSGPVTGFFPSPPPFGTAPSLIPPPPPRPRPTVVTLPPSLVK